MAVTTNSAKNMIPPELPRSWPMVMNPITRVLSRRGLIIDSTPLAVVLRTISIDSRDKLIPYVGVIRKRSEQWTTVKRSDEFI